MLEELRYVRPRLSGEALLKMGVPQGPEVGEILARLRNARLDGDVTAEEDEMALARELLAQKQVWLYVLDFVNKFSPTTSSG